MNSGPVQLVTQPSKEEASKDDDKASKQVKVQGNPVMVARKKLGSSDDSNGGATGTDYDDKNADGSGNVEKQFTISIGDLADGGTGARWLIERYDSSGNTTNVQYYVSSTQYCNGSSLAVIPNSCFGLNKFVRFVTSAGGCGSTEYAAGKIINVSVSDGAIGAYISGSGAQWFNTAQDAHNDTNAVNC